MDFNFPENHFSPVACEEEEDATVDFSPKIQPAQNFEAIRIILPFSSKGDAAPAV